MDEVSIVGYATIMDPDNAKKIGLEGTPNPVWVNGFQRFFGFPDCNLVGKTIDQIFDVDGNLIITDIGATTVQPSESRRYNAVVYKGVSEGTLAELDRIEGASHLERLELVHSAMTNFGDNSAWIKGGNHVYVYVAKEQIVTPDRRTLQMLRADVTP